MPSKAKVTASMEWKGQRLLCNGRRVADIGRYPAGDWWASADDFFRGFDTAVAARRYVNRRFKLPVSFGEPE